MNNYILIKITGKDVKRFVLSLYKKGINFYNIKYQGKICYIKVTENDYKKIKDIKTIYKIEIVRLYGFIKIKDILNRYNDINRALVVCKAVLYITDLARAGGDKAYPDIFGG